MVEAILKVAGGLPAGYSKVGDDVATVPARAGRLVVKADMLVESTDVPKGMSYRQAARKAVAACVSDFAAKGARPDSFLVSIGLRKRTKAREVRSLGEGFRDAGREWGVRLVGGDTNESKELVIDCSMVGFSRRVVGRVGAKEGDALVVTGKFGYPPAGLKILAGGARSEEGFRRAAVGSVLLPSPNLKVGLALGRHLSSAMDSSDGLARSIHTLAKASGVGFELRKLPLAAGVKKFARENGLDWEELVLEGGEEYVVVGTVKAKGVAAAAKAAKRAGGRLEVIGLATSRADGVVLSSKGKKREIADAGWTHLG